MMWQRLGNLFINKQLQLSKVDSSKAQEILPELMECGIANFPHSINMLAITTGICNCSS